MGEEFFPKMITDLPEIDISLEGVRGWLLQGTDRQVVFFEIEPIGAIPEHSHGEQWGIIIEGEAELVVNGVKKICRKGDYYHIPSGALHSVTIRTPLKAIDFFAEANRHKAKPKR